MDDALAHALVVVAAVLTLFQVLSFATAAVIARQLRGREGGELARLLMIGTLFVAIAQALRFVHAVLLDNDIAGTVGIRIRLFFIEQAILVVCAIALGVWARRLWQNDRNGDSPPRERSEIVKSVGVQVDQVSPASAIAVDDRHDNTP